MARDARARRAADERAGERQRGDLQPQPILRRFLSLPGAVSYTHLRADTAGERFPAARADDLGILHLAAQQHQADHDKVLGNGRAVGAGGVGEPTVGILVQAVVAEVVHTRPAAAIPLEAFRAADDLLRAVPVEDLTEMCIRDRNR